MKPYSLNNAYIVATGSFLPGKPITNDEMENYLGLVGGKPSRYRRRILQSNGIKERYYALDENGSPTHMTDQLAAEAIKHALIELQADQNSLDMIAVGCTVPDLLAPGIASMVQGRIGGKNADIISCAGLCGAGAAALKTAAMSVIVGQHQRAVACGVERLSVILRGSRFKKESEISREKGDERIAETYKYFNADFLRWMLSDGAGAFIIDNKPKPQGISLKIDWVETTSYANELPTCMYMGTSNPNSPNITNTWWNQRNLEEVDELGLLLLRQDTKLLSEHIVDIVVRFAEELKQKQYFQDQQISWYLPHISSYFFYEKLLALMVERGFDIPDERWFTNLSHKGNTGAASIFIMLDEFIKSGRAKAGEKILLMIPESGRFSVTYALLTVEEHTNDIKEPSKGERA